LTGILNEEGAILNLIKYARENGNSNEIQEFLKCYYNICTNEGLRQQIDFFIKEKIDPIGKKILDIPTNKKSIFELRKEIQMIEADNERQRNENEKKKQKKATKVNGMLGIKITKSETENNLREFVNKLQALLHEKNELSKDFLKHEEMSD